MPKSTFLNLPKEKRDRLISSAITEFSSQDFESGNLDRIAEKANVSKGSLYQYFMGKEDLYVFAVEVALERVWEFFELHIEKRKPQDCFELLREAILYKFTLSKKRPELAAIYSQAINDRCMFREEFASTLQGYHDRFHEEFYQWGISDGILNPRLSREAIRFQVHAIGTRWNSMILTSRYPDWLPQSERAIRLRIGQSIDLLRMSLQSEKL